LRREAEAVARGTNRLVRLLRVAHLPVVAPGPLGHVVVSVELLSLCSRRGESLFGEGGGVGPHVGDVTALVQPLGDTHRGLCREAELPACFLLERRGYERGRGLSRVRLILDAAHREHRVREALDQAFDVCFLELYGLRAQGSVGPEVTALRKLLA